MIHNHHTSVLPDDCLLHVMTFLQPSDVLDSARCVNRQWRCVSENDMLWAMYYACDLFFISPLKLIRCFHSLTDMENQMKSLKMYIKYGDDDKNTFQCRNSSNRSLLHSICFRKEYTRGTMAVSSAKGKTAEDVSVGESLQREKDTPGESSNWTTCSGYLVSNRPVNAVHPILREIILRRNRSINNGTTSSPRTPSR